MATSFTVTGLYQDRPAKRGTLQACCLNLLVSLVQANYATGLAELSDGHGLCQGKTRVKAKCIICARSVQTTSTETVNT